MAGQAPSIWLAEDCINGPLDLRAPKYPSGHFNWASMIRRLFVPIRLCSRISRPRRSAAVAELWESNLTRLPLTYGVSRSGVMLDFRQPTQSLDS